MACQGIPKNPIFLVLQLEYLRTSAQATLQDIQLQL
jgi:hypothetical protein